MVHAGLQAMVDRMHHDGRVSDLGEDDTAGRLPRSTLSSRSPSSPPVPTRTRPPSTPRSSLSSPPTPATNAATKSPPFAATWHAERQPPSLGETGELDKALEQATGGRRVSRELGMVVAGLAAMVIGATMLVDGDLLPRRPERGSDSYDKVIDRFPGERDLSLAAGDTDPSTGPSWTSSAFTARSVLAASTRARVWHIDRAYATRLVGQAQQQARACRMVWMWWPSRTGC